MDYQKHLEICRKATKGEWEVTCLSEEEVYITKGYRLVNGMHVAEWIAKIDSGDDKSVETKLDDADFIAFARNHAEQYITRCIELEAENKRLKQLIINTTSGFYCPNDHGFEANYYQPSGGTCNNFPACKDCWAEALEG